MPTIRYESIRLSHELNAHVQLVLPHNFDPTLKYPILLSIYAGPNSNSVEKRNPSYVETYFVQAYSIIAVQIDARGSALRGWSLKQRIYRHLGGPEIEDQMEALRLLLKRYSYLDSKRVSISGWVLYSTFISLYTIM